MLLYAALYYAMFPYVALCYPMLPYIALIYVALCCPSCPMLRYVALYRPMLHYIALCCAMSHMSHIQKQILIVKNGTIGKKSLVRMESYSVY